MSLQILAQAHSNAWRSPAHIDHNCLLFAVLGNQPHHHPREDALFAPALPTAVEHLVRAIGFRSITPPLPIAVDEGYPAQNPPVVDPWLAMRLWKAGFQTRHLCVAQLENIAHVTAPFSEP